MPVESLDPALFLLLIGSAPRVETLRFQFADQPGVEQVRHVGDQHHAWGEIRRGTINAIVIDLSSTFEEVDAAVLGVFQIRAEFPEIVFGIIDDGDLDQVLRSLDPAIASRLSHYYRVPSSATSTQLQATVKSFLAWHREIVAERPNTPRYVYDVALSFAGEDRRYAEAIATILRAQGVRVFYDDFEQADLWGKNLVDHLHKIYAEDARFCIILVSRAYVQKMWTGHERQAAQERALASRDSEYILPVRIDDSQVPGLPATVAYLDIKSGPEKIANLFVRKLGVRIGKLS